MCGITGIIAPSVDRYHGAMSKMLSALVHRGPDSKGLASFGKCILGHTRLSIVDLAGSPQPMVNREDGVSVTFNGEIYDYQRIRSQLAGYPFQTAGDTEVLLALYQKYGLEMLPHLPGMFAFAIWDDRKQSLLCGRDRFGEKPFYYSTGRGGEFIFGSEIKAILASGLVDPVLNPQAVRHYLRRGYVHPTQTIYQNVQTLPPAHRLIYSAGRLDVQRYWKLPASTEPIGMESAREQFRHLFENGVARQMVADVPVGVFLSGGLDSSTIVSVAARKTNRCRTFSFGFGKSINELPYAREIAHRYGTEHLELTDEQADLAVLLGQMQTVYDEPFGDSSNIPTFLLSRLARQHITVALAGEGSDELTAGYDFWYRPIFNYERAGRLPKSVASLIRIAAAGFKLCGAPLPRSLAELWEGFFLLPHYHNALEAHYARNGYFSNEQLDSFKLPDESSILPNKKDGGLDGVLRADLQDYLPGDVLTKTDRASMASGLEVRCPYLDIDFASFCVSLPTRLKLNAVQEKIILRSAFSEAWTPSIQRRKKQGFGAPVRDWLQQPPLRELKAATLGNRQHKLYQIIPFEHANGIKDRDDYQTWLLLVLALWAEKHPYSTN